MICINRHWLTEIGINDLQPFEAADANGQGFATSALLSFGGGGNGGRDTKVLDAEIEAGRTALLLVGMADRYDEAKRRGVIVTETGLDDQGRCVKPTDYSIPFIHAALAESAYPLAAVVASALRRIAA